MSVAFLDGQATGILSAALAGLAAATTGHAPPSIVYVSHGPPVADVCDDGLLTVHLDTITHEPVPYMSGGMAGPGIVQCCQIVPTATWIVTLLRCVPGLNDSMSDPFPSDDDLDDSAGDLLIDLWALLTEFYDRLDANTLVPGMVDCCDISIGDAIPIPPDGQVAGWTVTVSATCNDAGPVGS